jgi:hypothetical protein
VGKGKKRGIYEKKVKIIERKQFQKCHVIFKPKIHTHLQCTRIQAIGNVYNVAQKEKKH